MLQYTHWWDVLVGCVCGSNLNQTFLAIMAGLIGGEWMLQRILLVFYFNRCLSRDFMKSWFMVYEFHLHLKWIWVRLCPCLPHIPGMTPWTLLSRYAFDITCIVVCTSGMFLWLSMLCFPAKVLRSPQQFGPWGATWWQPALLNGLRHI